MSLNMHFRLNMHQWWMFADKWHKLDKETIPSLVIMHKTVFNIRPTQDFPLMWKEVWKVGHSDLNMARDTAQFLVVLACNVWWFCIRPDIFCCWNVNTISKVGHSDLLLIRDTPLPRWTRYQDMMILGLQL